MCSICGIVDRVPVRKETIDGMNRVMRHRGPDRSETLLRGTVALGHNRLAVMDPEHGAQPMTRRYKNREATVVYNGEIYNTNRLRAELNGYGVTFETDCDTEVVLYAYLVFGERCPEKLNGIFAFCVLDGDTLFFARDRFGVKPLYYAERNGTFYFASEVKALLAAGIPAEIDRCGLYELLYLSPCQRIGSGVFRDVHEVPPAYCGTFKNGELTLWEYWKIEAKPPMGVRNTVISDVRELVTDAIRSQLSSDVPLCSLLSGGLDSTVVSAVAASSCRERGSVLATYSFEYEGNRENFRPSLFQPQGDDDYARFAARYLRTEHTVLTASTDDVADCLEAATYARDLPGQADVDSSLYYFCREIRREHTVALSGECADEIFGGYPWFYRPEMLSSGFFPWIHAPRLRASLFHVPGVDVDDGYDYIAGLYRDAVAACPVLDGDSPSMRTSRIASHLSVTYFMTSLLQRKDRMSMASGLEIRVPFSDYRIYEYLFNVPWEIKFENGVEKALLRNAMRGVLPERIADRKKSPYPKTHHPRYRERVQAMLDERLSRGGFLAETLDRARLDDFLRGENTTWFGQLMSAPQLLAWLVQLDLWFEHYRVRLV